MRGADLQGERSAASRRASRRSRWSLAFLVLAGARRPPLGLRPARRRARRAPDGAHATAGARRAAASSTATATALALTVEAPSVYADAREVRRPGRGGAHARARPRPRPRRPAARALNAAGPASRSSRAGSAASRPTQIEAPRSCRASAILREPRRVYPHRALAAQLVGFANIDGDGVRGDRAAGGRLAARHDPAHSRSSATRGGRLLGPAARRRPAHAAGGDVALTLDAALQADARARAAREAMKATGARGGLVVAIDPHSGDVLALAEAPSLRPEPLPRHASYAATRLAAPSSTPSSRARRMKAVPGRRRARARRGRRDRDAHRLRGRPLARARQDAARHADPHGCSMRRASCASRATSARRRSR